MDVRNDRFDVPGQRVLLQMRHGDLGEAERVPVKRVGLLERARRDGDVDVCDSCDHLVPEDGSTITMKKRRLGRLEENIEDGCLKLTFTLTSGVQNPWFVPRLSLTIPDEQRSGLGSDADGAIFQAIVASDLRK
jgi:hypothetical protein